MDGSTNSVVIISKYSGVLPLTIFSENKFLNLSIYIYDIFLIIFSIYGHKLRGEVFNGIFSQSSLMTSIGLKIRMTMPSIFIFVFVIVNLSCKEKIRAIFYQMKEFDRKVIKN